MKTKLEDLRKWFGKGKKGDWVRVGTDGEIKGDCAREPGEGKPKCMPRSKAHSMSKKDRASSARRKRSADPQADRPGTGNTPIMVKTDKEKKKKVNESSKVPAGMKFIASYVYKDANGKDHTHTHFRKGKKMTDPVVVHIDRKEWKTFQSFTKAKQAAINHIKGMKESVEMNEAIDFFKVAKEFSDYAKKHGGTDKKDFERVGQFVRELGMNSDVNKQDATFMKMRRFIRGLDTDVKDGVLQIMKKHGMYRYHKGMDRFMRESVDLEEKNVPTNPALWAKFKAQAKAKFDVYPSAYANGWAAKKYKAAGGGWKTTKESTEMKSFWDIREGKESVEEGMFMITVHKAGPGGKDLNMKVMGKDKMDAAKAFRKSNPRYKNDEISVKESVEEAVGDTALAFQTPHGTVTATKRNTKGMRGKQDGYSLSLKTKSGKTVDLGSHPKPTKANVMSIAKSMMS